ncbi:MAG: hypothetical protein H7836_08165 [Magnetococcus sp. YQC-3]
MREFEEELRATMELAKKKTKIKVNLPINEWLRLVIVKNAFSSGKHIHMHTTNTKVKKTIGDIHKLVDYLYKHNLVNLVIDKLNEYINSEEATLDQENYYNIYYLMQKVKNQFTIHKIKERRITLNENYTMLLQNNDKIAKTYLVISLNKDKHEQLDIIYNILKKENLLDKLIEELNNVVDSFLQED